MEKHYQFIGGPGGYGIGYGSPAAVGAALANRPHGRFSVNIQTDGDMMYAPGVLWTAAHHRIPLLTVMHNNRGYHQEMMHIQRMADRRNRPLPNGPIGTQITGPNVDYAKLAQSMGWWASGPITDPKDLAPRSSARSRWSRPANRLSSTLTRNRAEDRHHAEHQTRKRHCRRRSRGCADVHNRQRRLGRTRQGGVHPEGCWECHGTQGQGAVTGPRLAPDPIPLEAVANFIRNSTGPMPPYRKAILSDADLGDIYAYLQSIPKPPAVKDVPLLNQWADQPK